MDAKHPVVEKIHEILELFDVPGGVVVGVCFLGVLSVLIAKVVKPTIVIPAELMDFYKFTLGLFGGTKTVQTIFGKKVDATTPPLSGAAQ